MPSCSAIYLSRPGLLLHEPTNNTDRHTHILNSSQLYTFRYRVQCSRHAELRSSIPFNYCLACFVHLDHNLSSFWPFLRLLDIFKQNSVDGAVHVVNAGRNLSETIIRKSQSSSAVAIKRQSALRNRGNGVDGKSTTEEYTRVICSQSEQIHDIKRGVKRSNDEIQG